LNARDLCGDCCGVPLWLALQWPASATELGTAKPTCGTCKRTGRPHVSKGPVRCGVHHHAQLCACQRKVESPAHTESIMRSKRETQHNEHQLRRQDKRPGRPPPFERPPSERASLEAPSSAPTVSSRAALSPQVCSRKWRDKWSDSVRVQCVFWRGRVGTSGQADRSTQSRLTTPTQSFVPSAYTSAATDPSARQRSRSRWARSKGRPLRRRRRRCGGGCGCGCVT
jgi:hypothetical protein